MRILLVSQTFPPDSSSTATNIAELADELSKHHQVTVLCGRPSYNAWERHEWYPVRREKRGGYDVVRVGSSAFDRGGMRGRVLNYLTYSALAGLFTLFHGADVVVATTDPPPVGFTAALAARLKRVPFVYNIRDFHPDMALESGMLKPGALATAWEAIHRWMLRKEDAVIVVLGRDMRQRVVAKGVSSDRIRVVENTAPIRGSLPSADDPALRDARCGFPFVVAHAGNLGFYGSWDTLVEAARLLQNDGVGLLFIGHGAEQKRLEGLAAPLANVRFLKYRPSDEAWITLAAADLHVVAIRHGLQGLVVPAKLYPILAAGRPVLVVGPADSEPALLVSEERCGLVVDPDDPAGVAESIRWALRNPGELRAMGERARRVAQRFTPEHQGQRFRRVLEEVVSHYPGMPAP